MKECDEYAVTNESQSLLVPAREAKLTARGQTLCGLLRNDVSSACMSEMEEAKKKCSRIRSLRINQTMLPYKMFYFFCDGAMSCIAPYRSLYLKQLGLGPSRIGIVAAMKPLATFISNAMIGFLADRFGCRKAFMITSLVVWIASLLAFGFIPPASEVSDSVSRTQLESMVRVLNSSDLAHEEMLSRQVRSETAGGEEDEYHNLLRNKLRQLRCIVYDCALHNSSREDGGDHVMPKRVFSKLVQQEIDDGRHPSTSSGTKVPATSTSTSSPANPTSSPSALISPSLSASPDRTEEIAPPPRLNSKMASELASDRSWLFDQRELLHLFLAIMVITNVVYIAFGSFMRLADAATLSTLAKDPDSDMSDYGWHRSFGGLGWAVCSLTVGVLLSGTSTTVMRWGVKLVTTDYRVAFFAFAVVSVLAAFCSFFMDYDYSTCDWDTQWSALRRVMLSAHFGSVFFVAFFTGVCNGSVWGFLLWHFENLGASQTLIGALEALQSVSELALGFFCRRFLLSFGHISALTLGLGVYALRFVCYAIITNPLWLIPVEIFHGVSFLLTWTTLVSYFGTAVPAQCMTTVQGILGALYFGLGVGVGSLASGLIIDRFDAVVTFFGFAVASVVVMLLFMVSQQLFPQCDIDYGFEDDIEKQKPVDISGGDDKKQIAINNSLPAPFPVKETLQQVVDLPAHMNPGGAAEKPTETPHQKQHVGLRDQNKTHAARPRSNSYVMEVYAAQRRHLAPEFAAPVAGETAGAAAAAAAVASVDMDGVLSPLLHLQRTEVSRSSAPHTPSLSEASVLLFRTRTCSMD